MRIVATRSLLKILTMLEHRTQPLDQLKNFLTIISLRTGRVAFDAMGDRLFAEYKVQSTWIAMLYLLSLFLVDQYPIFLGDQHPILLGD